MKKFYKSLICSLKTYSGRNRKGRITVRHREGGCKALYRKINFNLPFMGLRDNYKLIRVEYDPNRNCFIGLLYNYNANKFDYILLPEGLNVEDYLLNSSEPAFSIKPGYRTELKNLPLGTLVHNLSLDPIKGLGLLCRSKGSYAKILQKNINKKYVRVKLPSGEERLILDNCRATIGMVSGKFKSAGTKNAGYSRRLGKRPSVRGVAMNPVDHPHGGGEGRTSGGRCSVSPWGKLTKGKPTVYKKKKYVIRSRKQL